MNRLPGEQDGRQAYNWGHSVSLTQFLVLDKESLEIFQSVKENFQSV